MPLLTFAFEANVNASALQSFGPYLGIQVPVQLPQNSTFLLHKVVYAARYRIGAGLYHICTNDIFGSVANIRHRPPGLVEVYTGSSFLGNVVVAPLAPGMTDFGGIEIDTEEGDLTLLFEYTGTNGFTGTDLNVRGCVVYEITTNAILK